MGDTPISPLIDNDVTMTSTEIPPNSGLGPYDFKTLLGRLSQIETNTSYLKLEQHKQNEWLKNLQGENEKLRVKAEEGLLSRFRPGYYCGYRGCNQTQKESKGPATHRV